MDDEDAAPTSSEARDRRRSLSRGAEDDPSDMLAQWRRFYEDHRAFERGSRVEGLLNEARESRDNLHPFDEPSFSRFATRLDVSQL